MSGIIGSITAGRLAFAIGTVGVGALVGGAIADHRDGDVAKGALIGGASALAGLALLVGGTAAWRHFSSGRANAAQGAASIGTTLSHGPLPVPSAASSLSTATSASRMTTTAATSVGAATSAATHAATSAATHAATATGGGTAAAAATNTGWQWKNWVSSLFQDASTVATLRPLPVTVPAFAATPALPVATTAASSGTTFLTTMRAFL